MALQAQNQKQNLEGTLRLLQNWNHLERTEMGLQQLHMTVEEVGQKLMLVHLKKGNEIGNKERDSSVS